MALIVQKYGGTSVGDVDRITNVAHRVTAARRAGQDVVVVVSAMAGETDRLIGLAHKIAERPNERELDMILATGEQVSIGLLSLAIQGLGLRARSFTGGQVRIQTDDVHTKARIVSIDAERVRQGLADGEIAIVAGFQGVSAEDEITTLGRGCARSTPTWTGCTPQTRASSPRRGSWIASPTTRCWRWPAWGPRCSRHARWSTPRTTGSRSTCAPASIPIQAPWWSRRMRPWKELWSRGSPTTSRRRR